MRGPDGNLWVCTDCYFAHHYGAEEHDGKWYAGESDQPADREPLGLADGIELTDNVCSNHELTETGELDEFGDPIMKCEHCDRGDEESGEQEFSWSTCDGCGSSLGGSRYRLAYWLAERK